MRNLDQLYKVWITKHVSGFCVTNKIMVYRSKAQSPTYSLCEEVVIEYTHHQVYYTHNCILIIEAWLAKNNTHPSLRHSIINYVQGRRKIPSTVPGTRH